MAQYIFRCATALCHFSFLTATHGGDCASFQVLHSCSLEWFHVIPLLLPLTGWLFVIPDVSPLLTEVAPHHLRCTFYSYSDHSVLSHVFHSCLLGWLHVISAVSLPLTNVALNGLRFIIATHWGGSVLSHVFHCHTIRWL